jgi:hypothetical protein
MRRAIKRTTNPQLRGYVEAFYVVEGKVMVPEDLSVGQHSLQFTGLRPGQPPSLPPDHLLHRPWRRRVPLI